MKPNKSVQTVVLASLVALTGCAGGFKRQVPGDQLGGGKSQSVEDAQISKEAGEHHSVLGGFPRAVDCGAVKEDPNGEQPTPEEMRALQQASSKIVTGPLPFDARVERLDRVTQAEKVIAEHKAKFGPVWCSARGQDGSKAPNDHEGWILDLGRRVVQVKQSEMPADAKVVKANFVKALATVTAGLAEHRAIPTTEKKGEYDLNHRNNPVSQALFLDAAYAVLQLGLLLGEANPEVVAMTATYHQAVANFDEEYAAIKELMAEKFEMAKEKSTTASRRCSGGSNSRRCR